MEGEPEVVCLLGALPLPVRPLRFERLVQEVVAHLRGALSDARPEPLGLGTGGLEGLTRLDPDAGEHVQHHRVPVLRWFLVDHLGQQV